MSVSDILESMEYGPAPESAAEALAWLDANSRRFGHFINGTMTEAADTFETRNPADGSVLAEISQGTDADVRAAVAAARAAQPAWAGLSGHARARHLYALARLCQKHARLLAVLETLDTGKPIRESRDIDIPLVQRHFYYHAGMAQLMATQLPERSPLGVCAQVIPWNFPLLMLAWKVAPALAAGNTVVLKPAEYTPLTALFFAEICTQAGLPAGTVNIVTGDGATGAALVDAEVDKVAFTGSTEVGRRIREATAGRDIPLTLELGGKSPYIVFEDADLDSAVEGLVDAIWFNGGQVCCAGSRLLVQEGIADAFHAKLRTRMASLRIGDPLDKCIDVGAIVDPVQHARIAAMVAANTAGETFVAPCPLPDTGCFYPPTLIAGLAPADPLMQEEIFGPVLVSGTFRTPDEAIALANNTRYGLAASVWSENINTALDIAPRLEAGVIWVNGTNMFDAAAGFGGVRESGFGREGGWEGMYAYTKGPSTAPAPALAEGIASTPDSIDRTAKMYVGGKQARPDSGHSIAISGAGSQLLGHVGAGSRKDIRNAVEAAGKAAGWSASTAHLRAQILYYMAENLAARGAEMTARLAALGVAAPEAELEDALDALFSAAAWADKLDGAAKPVPLRGTAIAMNAPVGTIGIICPDGAPLAAPIRAMAAALAMGNRVVLVPSPSAPLAMTDFYQVLETSDVPAGVVNIVTGPAASLADTLADHLGLDALWCFGQSALSEAVERRAAGNLKRSWIAPQPPADMRETLRHATTVKTVWIPWGA
ncbi:MAG: aldehyde dehydrogenase family protein [Oceanicola sp.]|nr:aldehyde dehydrogenase family protein [Oceanicola sp.]